LTESMEGLAEPFSVDGVAAVEAVPPAVGVPV